MSKLKQVPRFGWFVIGIVVAVLLVPTGVAAAKAGLKFTGIQGTSGSQADVTSAGQLQTATAAPGAAFENLHTAGSMQTVVVATPPAGEALIITSVHVNVWGLSGTDPYVYLTTRAGSCTGSTVSFFDEVDPSASGMTVLPFDPGLPIPSTEVLCATAINLSANVETVGYSVASASVPAAAHSGQAPTALKK
jgi:hypothetical protein